MSVSPLLRSACLALAFAAAGWAASGPPPAVSPGAPGGALIGDVCPTFSWGAVPGARLYELVVYRLQDQDTGSVPALRERIPGSALSWTPSLDRCLERGDRYAWSVRAVGPEEVTEWSAPSLFEVAAGPSALELEAALHLLRSSLDPDAGAASESGAGGTAGAKTAARSEAESGASSPGPRAVGSPQLTVDGGVVATSFTGDGSTLTDLAPANLAAPVPLAKGGTAATDAAGARTNLGAAAQSDYDTHVASATAHHVPTVDTTCNGAACDGTAFTNLQWANLAGTPAGFADGVDDDTLYTAGPGLELSGTQFGLTAFAGPPRDNTLSALTMSVSGATAIAVGTDGRGLIAFFEDAVGFSTLKAAHCDDAACTSAAVSVLDTSVRSAPSMTIGSDGRGLVSYVGGGDLRLKVAHCSDVACTTASTAALDGPGVTGWDTSVAIGADGRALIAYWIKPGDGLHHLRVAHCDSVACDTAAVSTVFSSASGQLGVVSLAVGPDGRGLLSFGADFELWSAHCDNAACSSATLSTLDPGTAVWEASITVGGDGLGLIVYRRRTVGGDELRVAHCDDAVCTTAATALLDSAALDALRLGDVTLGADDLGAISYHVAGTLKTARCSDTACSWATLATVDDGSTGFTTSSSITTGSDGRPLISYEAAGAPTTGLRAAHCANAFCAPYYRPR